jgi:predicted TIM-barrel fold metal-dependent hydrolase
VTRYFDCCCEIGPRNEKDPAAPWSVDDVVHWMDRCGIAAALAVHTLAVHGNVVQSRRRIKEDIARARGRLLPVWTLMPPDAGDYDAEPKKLLAEMAAEGVRAVKLFPRTHNYPLCPSVMAPVLKPLEDKGILTMIDFTELPAGAEGAFVAMDSLLEAFPRLPVLLQRTVWSMQRIITALMERHANLHIEFSMYQINRGIERYVRRFGPRRLLFGTGLPAMSAGAARCLVDYAQIPPEAKTLIAGGNLSRLLGGVQISDVPLPDDPLIAAAASGAPLEEFDIQDAHCHVLHEDTSSAGGYVMYRGDAEGILKLNDALGIRAGTLTSWTGPLASDTVDGNDVVARALKRHPGRFYGLVYINPVLLSKDQLVDEMLTRLREPGWVGLKPYPSTGLAYDDPLYAPCWQAAQERGLMALLHLGGRAGSVKTAAKLAEEYPNAQWVIAHTGGSFATAREVAAVMKEHPNIWAELTLTPVTNGVIEWLAAEVGDDRILFGTDAPMRDPRPQLGWVVWADLPLASRRKILGENFRRLLAKRTNPAAGE